jgi:hypothetical protein
MRKLILPATIIVLSSAVAVAEQPPRHKADKSAPSGKSLPGKSLPVKRPTSASACAEYGAGFVRIEGTNTCIKIGGAIGIGAGISSGSR